jgi:hypothetical protein
MTRVTASRPGSPVTTRATSRAGSQAGTTSTASRAARLATTSTAVSSSRVDTTSTASRVGSRATRRRPRRAAIVSWRRACSSTTGRTARTP